MRADSVLSGLLGNTGRQRFVAVLIVVLGLAVAISMVTRQWSLGAALSGLLLAGGVLVALDLRRRAGQLRYGLTRQSDSARSLAKAIELERQHMRELAHDIKELAGGMAAIHAELKQLGIRQEVERSRHGRLLQSSVGNAARHPQEVEALLQLYSRVSPRAPMPPSGRWALNPTGLLNLYSLVGRCRPGLVVEIGSGTSTVWLGYALEQQGYGRVVSVDHLPEYAEQTRAAIRLHDMSAISEVRLAALVDTSIDDETFQWYDTAALADLDQIDLLFVDGPPGMTGHISRYPALPLLLDRLADGAFVVLDDIDRADEQEIVERWLKYAPGLTRETTIVGDQAILCYRASPSTTPGAGPR